MRISKKFIKMSEIYKMFVDTTNPIFDFSEAALEAQYKAESLGGVYKFDYAQPNEQGIYNGFAIGKHWMDVTIKMWLKDYKSGNLHISELYDEPNPFPKWFLIKIFSLDSDESLFEELYCKPLTLKYGTMKIDIDKLKANCDTSFDALILELESNPETRVLLDTARKELQ